MGVKLFDIRDIIKYVMEYLKTYELDVMELGEQELKILNNELDDPLVAKFLKTNPREYEKDRVGRIGVFCKDYLESLFLSVTCLDVEAKCDKTLILSLCDEIKIGKQFDVVTNFGTTEHVGQLNDEFKNMQYLAFRNIHNMLRRDGIVFNVVPAYYPNQKDHGAFNYTCKFFSELAKLCNYKVIYNEIGKRGDIHHVYCYFIKKDANEFIDENTFMSLKKYIHLTKLIEPEPKKYFKNYKLV
tara:strand:+ start:21854 stop:22579 length:726 start_codon:yes stop_codon:yes gene_type:complete